MPLLSRLVSARESFRVWVACAPWSVLPPLLWFLVASPLLSWALGVEGRWFRWPRSGETRPWRRGFWLPIGSDSFHG